MTYLKSCISPKTRLRINSEADNKSRLKTAGKTFQSVLTHILHQTIKIAATRTKPAYAGSKTIKFTLVRAGGH